MQTLYWIMYQYHGKVRSQLGVHERAPASVDLRTLLFAPPVAGIVRTNQSCCCIHGPSIHTLSIVDLEAVALIRLPATQRKENSHARERLLNPEPYRVDATYPSGPLRQAR